MKNHLKRIAAPRTWVLDRKTSTFATRPNPGGHPLRYGLPLGIILRDYLHLALTMTEVRKLLRTQEVFVDGRRRTDHRFIVGLFDVLTLPAVKKAYRVVLDPKGRLAITNIPQSESTRKPCKVLGKTALPKGKLQYHLHDGKNISTIPSANVGDTLVVSLPTLTVEEILPLHPGALVFLTDGKHSGDQGMLKMLERGQAVYTKNGRDVETSRAYLFVVGPAKSTLSITATTPAPSQ